MTAMSNLNRNALTLALVLTAANLATSVRLIYESHQLHDLAAQCVSQVHFPTEKPVQPQPPKVGNGA
jgi:hypothetical protein